MVGTGLETEGRGAGPYQVPVRGRSPRTGAGVYPPRVHPSGYTSAGSTHPPVPLRPQHPVLRTSRPSRHGRSGMGTRPPASGLWPTAIQCQMCPLPMG